MFSLMLAGIIGTFNETAINIAISDLINQFSITESTVQWLSSGYLLTLGILVPVSGLLIQWFTTRQLFLAAVLISIVGSAVGGVAGSFEILLLGRILQAVGAGLLFPLMFNTALIIFPVEKRGSAMGLVTLVFTVGPAIGPTVSGLLLVTLSWHWIFWVSLITLLVALVVGAASMKNVSPITKPRIDVYSLILSTLGFGGIVFAVSTVGESDHGWNNPKVIVSLILGVVALVLFVVRQLNMKEPLMNLRTLKKPMFVIGTALVFVCMMSEMAAMFIIPMFMIRVLEINALTVGLILLPGSILSAVLSPAVGALFDKYGPKFLVVPGLILAAGSLWFFSSISMASTITFIIIMHSCLMIGIVMVWMPSQSNGLNQLPAEMYPDGTAIMSTLQQIAGALGLAVAVSVMTSGAAKFMKDAPNPTDPATGTLALVDGMQSAMLYAMFIAIAGLILAVFIRRVRVTQSEWS
ncbi:DHA2 family efflux MFS transporter permease subunit [Paenibacillus sp. MMS20-IR301]|nr:DHA2 family efflux MFS transporter permease subunit [Paenibacillus sp. MMS20-IR301]WNS46971.1 DHA2 family efflux MFS transporter permease subunit [Paenibacillus sp. MMS20-IR301]